VFGSLYAAVLKISEGKEEKNEVFIRKEKGQALPANFGKRVG